MTATCSSWLPVQAPAAHACVPLSSAVTWTIPPAPATASPTPGNSTLYWPAPNRRTWFVPPDELAWLGAEGVYEAVVGLRATTQPQIAFGVTAGLIDAGWPAWPASAAWAVA